MKFSVSELLVLLDDGKIDLKKRYCPALVFDDIFKNRLDYEKHISDCMFFAPTETDYEQMGCLFEMVQDIGLWTGASCSGQPITPPLYAGREYVDTSESFSDMRTDLELIRDGVLSLEEWEKDADLLLSAELYNADDNLTLDDV